MKDLITYVARNLVDDSNAVRVSAAPGDKTRVFELRVADSDKGKIIGKGGRTIRALRSLVNAAAAKDGSRAVLDVAD